MNDRSLDNQFPANTLSPEQLRQMQNIAALTGQGLLGNNINLLNPMALQNLINPILAASRTTQNNPLIDSSSITGLAASLDQQQPQQQSQPQPNQQQQQPHQVNSANLATGQVNLLQATPQNLSFKRRGRKPKHFNAANNSLIPSTGSNVAGTAGFSFNNFTLPQTNTINDNNNTAGGSTQQSNLRSDNDKLQLEQTLMILKQQSERRWQQQEQRQHQEQRQQQQQQQLLQQELTQRIHQQLQQMVQRSQQQQPQSSTLIGDQTSLTIRQQHALQNSLPQGALPQPPEQKRKRGRPPLSAPSTSSGSAGVDLNYLNMIVKSQQDRDKVQRDLKLQQERQRELRLQQERERQREMRLAQERAERQRELRLQQERERQRLEIERQRKAQHRMALQDIDRERRRQHMIMVRNLDSYKRNEEREKTMEAMIVERNKQNERRMYQKRLEVELIKDIRKPVDDMMLKNHKPLATLNRIPGLKLPGKAFADLLMSFEFLFNFGETVGLEHKEIPDMNTLQLGLLNLNTWAEDTLISLVHHLCMFAIKDPRFPYSGSLKEIENLERTNEGLSQLLHFYLQVLTLNAKTEMEHEFRLYKLIEQKYFLSLNATQKAEMLAFICNELLCSQTVTKQMEDTIENVAKFRKDKWVLENELRKYRVIKNKRELKEEALLKAREAAEAAAAATAAANAAAAAAEAEAEAEADNEDQKESDGSDKPTDSKVSIKTENDESDKSKTTAAFTNGSSNTDDAINKREPDMDAPTQPNITNDLDDMEPGMTNDELNKKIENLTRQYNKMSNKLEKAINSMRACPLGQDRYRRRYWVLPQVGGVFVEGMESSEPEELENNKFTEEELIEYEKEQQALNELANNNEEGLEEDLVKAEELKEDKESEDIDIKAENVDVKDEDEPMDIKEEDPTNNSEIRDELKLEPNEKVQHEIDKNANEANCDQANVSAAMVSSIPWFSILPRITCDFTKIQEDVQPVEGEDSQKQVTEDPDRSENKAELTSEELRAMRHEICPALAKRLEELEAEQHETPKKIHPQFQCGWWRVTDTQQLKSILAVLHERGARERQLHKHLTKHFQYACNSCKNTTVDFEITSWDRKLAGQNYGAPVAHTDDDSADDLREGEEEEEEEEEEEDEVDDDTGDDKTAPQVVAASSKKSSKRKRVSRSARSRRLRARAAARKKVENSRSRLAQR